MGGPTNLNPFKIYQGAAPRNPPFIIKLNQTDEPGSDPVDLTGVVSISTCFKNADGTETTLTLTSGLSIVGNPLLGKVQVSYTAAQSALFDPNDAGTLEFSIVPSGGGDPWAVQVPGAFVVIPAAC